MKGKKDAKQKDVEGAEIEEKDVPTIETKADLKQYVVSVRDRLLKGETPPIFAMVAMKQVLTLPGVYDLMDGNVKEILQEIWVKLSQYGFQLRKPPLLFTEVEVG